MATPETDIGTAQPPRRRKKLSDYAGNGKDHPTTNATVKNRAVFERGGHLRLVMDYDFPIGESNVETLQRAFQTVIETLEKKHPGISVDQAVLAGTPHINGTRLSVAHILAELHHQGSVDAVVHKFRRLIDSQKVKAAIAYAHDFMEMACDLSEDDD